MSSGTAQSIISMVLYMTFVVGIGIYYAKRANESSDNYYLGGRSIGPWVAAFSAEASDMSGWLLMGLPGVAYWFGLCDAFYTALGLAIGTYLNWLLVSKRLRSYSQIANNSITIPDFFSNRFHEKRKVIMAICSIFILVFFSVYASSCFVTCGKLFSNLFNADYKVCMIFGAIFVVLYTILGGFLAESLSDFMQAIVMVSALVIVLALGLNSAGGFKNVVENLQNIPGFLDFFFLANPVVENSSVSFSTPTYYSPLTILSTLSWGLGYFGVPQVLLRFMAIKNKDDLTLSRRVGTVWVIISLSSSICIGLIGRVLMPNQFLSASQSENIFASLAQSLTHPLFAGLIMAGILAATISSSDSYLLIAASAFSKNLYKGIFKRDASDKSVMRVGKVVLSLLTLAGIILALDEESVIFNIVSFAWAGFGATFGPIMLFSLFYKRTTKEGAIAGLLTGGFGVFAYKLLVRPLGGIFDIYELLPAFLLSSVAIYFVSIFTKEPSKEIYEEFERAKSL